MNYHELRLKPHTSGKRIGRGIAAGQGKTAGRGTKGQKARTGSKKRPGFEGGQNPLLQRLPKLRGFRAIRPPAEAVYTGDLNVLKTAAVDNFSLYQAGLVSSPYVRLKLIKKGELTKKMQVKLQAASAGAIAAVQKAGGSFSITPQMKRQSSQNKTQPSSEI